MNPAKENILLRREIGALRALLERDIHLLPVSVEALIQAVRGEDKQ